MSKLQERLNALKNKGVVPLPESPTIVEDTAPETTAPVAEQSEVVEEKEAVDLSKLSLKERLALIKKTPASTPAVVSTVAAPNKVPSLKEMGEALRKMPALSDEDHEKAPAEVHSLRDRIWRLQTESGGESLRDAMKHLQVALNENPTAVSFFLPEDYQEMVTHIRKLTGNAVAQALAKPASKGKAKTATPQQEISLDDLNF